MMINGYSILPYRLAFKRPWNSHHGPLHYREGFLIELTDDFGNRGTGEAAPLPEMGTESLQLCHTQLQELEQTIHHHTIEEISSLLQPLQADYPALCCGIEGAAVALLAQLQQTTPACWLNREATDRVNINQILSNLQQPKIDPTGSPILKVKLGIHPIEQELTLLQQLAATLSPEQQIRLDPNGAWRFDQAQWFIQQLGGLPIESIEEPLQKPTLSATQQLQRQTEIPIALDESLRQIGFTTLLETTQPIQRAILKPTLLGGPLTCYNIARQLQQQEIETVITSTLESSIGITLAAHCAAAVDPQQRWAHGLDTARLFSEDLALAPSIKNGILQLP